MPRPPTQKNYRGWVKGVITSFNRLGEKSPMQKGVVANGIGNVYYHFGDPEARQWFETALTWYRRGSTDPWTGIAYVHWKLGDRDACAEECRRIIEHNGRKLEEKKSQGLEGAELWREYDETATACLLLGDFETARRWAGDAIGIGIEARAPSCLHAIRDMANGVLARDRQVFEAGQTVARKGLVGGMWPTGDTGAPAELYRYSLALAANV